MKKIAVIFSLAIGFFVIAIYIHWYGWTTVEDDAGLIVINPRMPESVIETKILEITPLGISSADCLKNISTRLKTKDSLMSLVKGEWKTRIGCYGVIEDTCVHVFWVFDQNDRLKEIKIHVMTTGIP